DSLAIAGFLNEKGLTVSQFEDYLKCPYVFYARHVQKLKPEEELNLDPSSLAKGTLLHRILERCLELEINQGRVFEYDEGLKIIESILAEEVTKRETNG